MITLHRLGGESAEFVLNSELIVTVEASPDTHIALVTGQHLVVRESPQQVIDAIRIWRAEIARRAFATTATTPPSPAGAPDGSLRPLS